MSAAAQLPIADQTARPREFFRVCLKHNARLSYLNCPTGTHSCDRWGAAYRDEKTGRIVIVAMGTEDRIVLLDAFGEFSEGLKVKIEDVEMELALAKPASRARGRKLTAAKVSAMKREMAVPGWRLWSLAEKYGVTPGMVHMIRVGSSWVHVPGPPSVPPVVGGPALLASATWVH